MAFDKPAPSPGRSGRGGAPDQSPRLGKGRTADRNASADQDDAADRTGSVDRRGSLDRRDSSSAPGARMPTSSTAGSGSEVDGTGFDGTGRAWPRVRAAAPGNPSPIDRALLAPPILGRAIPRDDAGTTGTAGRPAPPVDRAPLRKQEPGEVVPDGPSDGPPVGRAALPGGTVVIGRATPPSGANRPTATPTPTPTPTPRSTPRSAPATDAGRAHVVPPADDLGTALPDRPVNAATPALRGHDLGVHVVDSGSDPTDEIGPTAGDDDTAPLGMQMPADDATATAGPGSVTFELSVRTTASEALRAAPRGVVDAVPHAGTRGQETQPDEQRAGAGTDPWSLESRRNPWSTADHGPYPVPRRGLSLAARPHTPPAQEIEPPTEEPQANVPRSTKPHSDGPQTNGPQTNGPQTNGPQTNGPQTNGPQTNERHTNGPQANQRLTNESQSDESHASEPGASQSRASEPRASEAARQRRRDPGLQLKPMVHVADMGESIRFYELLGAEIVHGDRDADWVLLQLGTTQIGLLAQSPDADRGDGAVELNFAAAMPLDELEETLRRDGVSIADMAAHRDFGVQLHIRTPDGLLIRISQLEPDLYT